MMLMSIPSNKKALYVDFDSVPRVSNRRSSRRPISRSRSCRSAVLAGAGRHEQAGGGGVDGE